MKIPIIALFVMLSVSDTCTAQSDTVTYDDSAAVRNPVAVMFFSVELSLLLTKTFEMTGQFFRSLTATRAIGLGNSQSLRISAGMGYLDSREKEGSRGLMLALQCLFLPRNTIERTSSPAVGISYLWLFVDRLELGPSSHHPTYFQPRYVYDGLHLTLAWHQPLGKGAEMGLMMRLPFFPVIRTYEGSWWYYATIGLSFHFGLDGI